MDKFLDYLKDKYSDEIGVAFSFFEILVFIIFLVVLTHLYSMHGDHVWGDLIFIKISTIFSGTGSIVDSIRIIDFIVALLTSFLTRMLYNKVKKKVFSFLEKLGNFDEYVQNLTSKYTDTPIENEAIRFYLASEQKQDKEKLFKQLSFFHGIGLLSFCLFITSVMGCFSFNAVDAITFFASLCIMLLVQWASFKFYVSKIVPKMVAESYLKGETIEISGEYKV